VPLSDNIIKGRTNDVPDGFATVLHGDTSTALDDTQAATSYIKTEVGMLFFK